MELDIFPLHLVTLFLIILFSIKLLSRKSFRGAETKYFWLTDITCFLLVLEDVLETMTAQDPALLFWRTLLSVLGYTLRSVAALSLLLVVLPKKRRSILLWIPVLITFLVSCTAFFTDIAFYFNEEYAFRRGPLGYVAFIVPILYLVLTLWFTFRHFSERKGVERLIPPVCAVFCLVAAAAGTLYGGIRLNEAIMISSVFFYMFLYSHDIRRDQLTGLLNRQSFYDDCVLYGKDIGAVASLDMNDLKVLNDTRGHQAGDRALQKIGESMLTQMDRRTAAYRVGGDEFLILFFHNDAAEIARSLQQILETAKQNGCSLSAGYAICSEHKDLEETIRESDRRMYEDKAEHHRRNGSDRQQRYPTVPESET